MNSTRLESNRSDLNSAGNFTSEDAPLVINETLQESLDEIDSAFPLYLKIWVTIATGIIFVVGVCGNTLVPILVWKNRQMRHSTNIFLLNLALADCLILLVCLPTALVELHTPPNTWVLGALLCRLVPFVEISVSRASVFTLTVISVERYIAICKPLRANSLCTRPRAFLVCFCIWPLSLLAAGPVLVATEYHGENYEAGVHHPSCVTSLHENWVSGYYLGSSFAFFILPLLFLSFIYFLIARKLLSHRARNNKKLDNAHWNARKQVAGMLGAVVMIFFVCLFPFQILIVWFIQAPQEHINSLDPHVYFNILFVCRVLLYINAAANPIVYNVMSAKFRTAVLRLFAKDSKKKTLRRQSTLTTTFSSSSTASSRSNSFRRIAHLALKRSFSDASVRRNNGKPRLSSPSVLESSPSSLRGFPLDSKTKDDRSTDRWYLRKGTSGSYFSGGDSVSSFSTIADDSLPPSPLNLKKSRLKSRYNENWDIRNGFAQDWNRSLPEIFPSSPASCKRVSFKDTALPRERPRPISPLTFTSPLVDKTALQDKQPSKNDKNNKGAIKYMSILAIKKDPKQEKQEVKDEKSIELKVFKDKSCPDSDISDTKTVVEGCSNGRGAKSLTETNDLNDSDLSVIQQCVNLEQSEKGVEGKTQSTSGRTKTNIFKKRKKKRTKKKDSPIKVAENRPEDNKSNLSKFVKVKNVILTFIL